MHNRPHVFIATPCFGGLVTQMYMQSVIALMQRAGPDGYDLSLAMLGQDALITRSRNTLVARFLSVPTASHLLFIDGDIGFEPEQVTRMLRFGKDLVAGMYPLKALHWDPRAEARLRQGEAAATAAMLYVGRFSEGPDAARQDGFVTAQFAGTGFMLISRHCIERMIGAYPQTRYRSAHVFPLPKGPEGDRYALFDCMIDQETGEYLSEDYTFCRRWRDLGGEVWLDARGVLTHCGTAEFRGDPATRFAA
ncbi:MAG TPA: hypothetical protein VME92_10890 [Acetobacteraceae bacterium]|nr:hypothetical protein [Acetobacteraceae bacterium]